MPVLRVKGFPWDKGNPSVHRKSNKHPRHTFLWVLRRDGLATQTLQKASGWGLLTRRQGPGGWSFLGRGGLVICPRGQLLGVLCGLQSSSWGWHLMRVVWYCVVEHSLWEEGCSVCHHYHRKQKTRLSQLLGIIAKLQVNLQEQECQAVVKWGGWPEEGCAAEWVVMPLSGPHGYFIAGSAPDSPALPRCANGSGRLVFQGGKIGQRESQCCWLFYTCRLTPCQKAVGCCSHPHPRGLWQGHPEARRHRYRLGRGFSGSTSKAGLGRFWNKSCLW